MRITSSPDQLILDSRPWITALIFGVMLFVVIALCIWFVAEGEYLLILPVVLTVAACVFWLHSFLQRNQLVIDKAAGTVTHSRRTLFSYTRIVHELKYLNEARVETAYTGKNREFEISRMAYFIRGGMDSGWHLFVQAHLHGKGSHRAADALNDWLDQNRGPLSSNGWR